MKAIKAFLLLGLLALSDAAMGQDLFGPPCSKAGIPKELAIAIARQESGLNPLVINVQGLDLYPKSHAQAVDYIRRAQAGKKSFDVGIMQINSQWFPKLGLDPVELLDPEKNIEVGVQILRKEIDRHGFNWLAVGRYHSPNAERGRRYAWQVFRRLGTDYDKAKIARRPKAEIPVESVPIGAGIQRGVGIQPKGRLITFRVREAGDAGGKDTESGKPAGHTRPDESER